MFNFKFCIVLVNTFYLSTFNHGILLFISAFRVNKPYLPIAAGDLSVQSAWVLVLSFAVVGLLIVGLNFGPFITSLYCLGLFLGTIYSVPPFRLKRYPVAAFLIISTVCYFSISLLCLAFCAFLFIGRLIYSSLHNNVYQLLCEIKFLSENRDETCKLQCTS